MTPRYPGARFYGQGGNGAGRCTYRSCSWHEAVTTAGVAGIASWNSGAKACHGFTAQDGDAGQFCDFHETVSGVKDGNGEVLTWENYDGLTPATNRSPDGSFGPNDRPFSPQMFERNADIAAWMSIAKSEGGLGIPLHLMTNTEQPGHGPHRLGVPQAGGKVKLNYGPTQWTVHPGKECPGDMRVQQLPSMLERAAVIVAAVKAGRCGWLPQGAVDLKAALARTGSAPADWFDQATVLEVARACR